MNREEIVSLMLQSFLDTNKELAEQSGMEEEEIEKFLDSSKGSIEYMLNGVYEALLEKDLLK